MNDRQGPGRQLEDTLIWTLLMMCIVQLSVGQQHDGTVELAQGIVVGVSVKGKNHSLSLPFNLLLCTCCS